MTFFYKKFIIIYKNFKKPPDNRQDTDNIVSDYFLKFTSILKIICIYKKMNANLELRLNRKLYIYIF